MFVLSTLRVSVFALKQSAILARHDYTWILRSSRFLDLHNNDASSANITVFLVDQSALGKQLINTQYESNGRNMEPWGIPPYW